MKVVVLNHSLIHTHIASVHRHDCRDIQREQRAHGSEIYGPFDSVEDALDDYLDEDMIDMGYGDADVKIHACAK